MATIEQILAVSDDGARDVLVPEWGGLAVKVASMSAADRAGIERDFAGKKAAADPAGFRVAVLAACLRGDDGKLLGARDKIAGIMAKSAKAIERLFAVACDISGLTPEAAEAIEKN